ncbi:Glycosyl transferase family 2 [Paracoccus isoporae]|uniref:Glycosyl transferase family 2 n=1 Tax=Paracoccus isoporae TaxID=591205 RepID=A0A1G6XQD8_9RHOB|nr:glycosyltransferase family 2 protein [Paracoccus isoporae]SDD79587.1 Glycosyl transferase family 2 [Paracoccus isoporae]
MRCNLCRNRPVSPTGRVTAGRRDMAGHVLLSSMKDEGPYVLEFVAHHRAIGFDAIHVASNDCSDGTDLLLDALAASGAITHTRNIVAPGERPQRKAYATMRAAFDLDRADWIMVLDVDEFLFVDTGAGRVADLTALAGHAVDVICLSALSFGTSQDPDWRPGSVTARFTRRLPRDSRHNGPVKSLSRAGRWGGIQNHHPVGYRGVAEITAMRGDGALTMVPNARLWSHLRHFAPDQIAHGFAWYNHYPIKTRDSFLLRQLRGNGAEPLGGVASDRWNARYWRNFASARIEDRRIIDRYATQMQAELARLLDLPGVRTAQAEAERRYGAMIASCMGDPTV